MGHWRYTFGVKSVWILYRMKRRLGKKTNLTYVFGLLIGLLIMMYIAWSAYSNRPLKEGAINIPKKQDTQTNTNNQNDNALPIWAIVVIVISVLAAIAFILRLFIYIKSQQLEASTPTIA